MPRITAVGHRHLILTTLRNYRRPRYRQHCLGHYHALITIAVVGAIVAARRRCRNHGPHRDRCRH